MKELPYEDIELTNPKDFLQLVDKDSKCENGIRITININTKISRFPWDGQEEQNQNFLTIFNISLDIYHEFCYNKNI